MYGLRTYDEKFPCTRESPENGSTRVHFLIYKERPGHAFCSVLGKVVIDEKLLMVVRNTLPAFCWHRCTSFFEGKLVEYRRLPTQPIGGFLHWVNTDDILAAVEGK